MTHLPPGLERELELLLENPTNGTSNRLRDGARKKLKARGMIEFIVRAVNCHDELVAALHNAQIMLVAFGGDPRTVIAEHGSASGDEIQAALLDEIDAALTRATPTTSLKGE